MAKPQTTTQTIHAAECDIWKIPEISSPDVLLGNGYEDEAVIVYLSGISPIYNALSRILAQFSGLLLLSMNAGRTILSLDHSMHSTALDQLCEVDEGLAATKIPLTAENHFHALEKIATQLRGVAANMDNLSEKSGASARKSAIMEIIQKLYSIQKLLIATAEPGANITPVDFTNACCNCRSTGALDDGKQRKCEG